MSNLVMKEISFDGEKILTIKDDEKIYVSVKSVCSNLGMSKSQLDNQIQKVQKDEFLKGALKFNHLKTNGGTQKVLVIELDYLPIWLAKINPIRFSDDLKLKLLDYQLRAKDVLADEFLGKREDKEQVRYEPEINEIEDRIQRIRENRNKIRKLLVLVANDYEWIQNRADLGYERIKANYQETKRTYFILDGKELSIQEIDKMNKSNLKNVEYRLNQL